MGDCDMSTTKKYIEIKDTQPPMKRCFFAFNNKQFEEAKARVGISPDEQVYHAGLGLYGTKDGIDAYLKAVDGNSARIPKECDPQDVYEYEFDNHECRFVGDDMEAIKLVVSYFGEDAAKTVKRHNGCALMDIENLF
jgi:hypothetical protein